MEHELKAWPEYYAAIDSGSKTCELRLNDRPYAIGDALLLREFEPVENGYTGRQLRVRVTHILNGGAWLAPGYIAMSIRLMGEDGRARVQEDFRASADRLRAEVDTERKRADAWIQERQALCHILSADSATVAGQTLVEALRAVVADRDEASADLKRCAQYHQKALDRYVELVKTSDQMNKTAAAQNTLLNQQNDALRVLAAELSDSRAALALLRARLKRRSLVAIVGRVLGVRV